MVRNGMSLLVVGAVFACLGCSKPKGKSEQGLDLPKTTQGQSSKTPGEPMYDPRGNLLESNTVIAGLHLPRGLKSLRAQQRTHVYGSAASAEKLQSYFGKRLDTGKVDRVGAGLVFRQARVRSTKGGVVYLDVLILPVGRARTRIEIVELPPPPAKPLTEAQVRAQLKEDSKHLD